MSEDCCTTSAGNIMLLTCSGGSNVGQLANQAAVELTQEGFGKIYCLAGIGGRLPGFVRSAKDVDQMIVIDGCELACGKATLESAGVPLKKHLILTNLGIEKNKDFSLKSKEIEQVKSAVRSACSEPSSASSVQQAPSGGCCCG